MGDVQWETYPYVAACQTARAWLQMQAQLWLAPKTVATYGESLNDYLAFCARCQLAPAAVTRAHIAAYVHDLATRPRAATSLLGQASQHLWLVKHHDVYQQFTCVGHTITP